MEFRLQWKTLELLEFGICVIGKQIFMDRFDFILFLMFMNYDDDTLRLKFSLFDYFFLEHQILAKQQKQDVLAREHW